jgi:hypothetical protein
MDVRELEHVSKQLQQMEQPILHVSFLDGSDSHPGRTMQRDQAGAVRLHTHPSRDTDSHLSPFRVHYFSFFSFSLPRAQRFVYLFTLTCTGIYSYTLTLSHGYVTITVFRI